MDAEHEEMMLETHRKTLWAQWTSLTLGAWLAVSPWTFGTTSGPLFWSDLITGLLVVAFSLRNLRPVSTMTRWGNGAAGIWLLFAPVVFWAPKAATLNNDWIVGAFLVTLNVLYPMMPGRPHHRAMMKPGPEVPPGWTYNPSTWLQRGPIIAMSLVAFLAARYMTANQLGHIESAWDPFFGSGTMMVLHSDISKAWPVSDAALGAVAYLLEALSGFMGGETRWRTMPWMVGMFGLLVIPLGVTSIVLVMLQPIGVGAWCTLCLFTALLMLLMLPLAVDEVAAMLHFMRLAHRDGQDLWYVFWIGGTLPETNEDDRTPRTGRPEPRDLPAMVWGVGLPWNLVASALIGMGLLFVPDRLGLAGTAAASVWLSGTLVAVVAVLALAEIVRPVRLLNIVFGGWLTISPWLLGGAWIANLVVVAAGVALVLLSLPRGLIRERYDDWTRFAKWRVHDRPWA